MVNGSIRLRLFLCYIEAILHTHKNARRSILTRKPTKYSRVSSVRMAAQLGPARRSAMQPNTAHMFASTRMSEISAIDLSLDSRNNRVNYVNNITYVKYLTYLIISYTDKRIYNPLAAHRRAWVSSY